jgi:serine/threonine protein kinase
VELPTAWSVCTGTTWSTESEFFFIILFHTQSCRRFRSPSSPTIFFFSLAARNVLLGTEDGKVIPKISDFGMSRYAVTNLQSTKTNHFALKWSAPESLKAFEYGKATDGTTI